MSRLFYEQLDDKLVNVLHNASGQIKRVSSGFDKVLGSPITQFASITQPEFGVPLYGAALLGNKIFKSIGIVSDGLADIVDRKSYKKADSTQKTVGNVLEKVSNTAKELQDAGINFV
jgi:hypothetical protein